MKQRIDAFQKIHLKTFRVIIKEVRKLAESTVGSIRHTEF